MAAQQVERFDPKSQSNVVRLPTAAPRQVPHIKNRAQKAAAEALPQLKCRYIAPEIRVAMQDARNIIEADNGAFQALALAMFTALGEMDKRRVEMFLALKAEKHNTPVRQALSLVRYETGSVSHQLRVSKAIELIESGGAEL